MTCPLPDRFEAPAFGVSGITDWVPHDGSAYPISESCSCDDPIFGSTACPSGYTSNWALVGDRLLLVSLAGRRRLVPPGPHHASWVSGFVLVRHGVPLERTTELLVTSECTAFEFERGVLCRARHWQTPTGDAWQAERSLQAFAEGLGRGARIW